MVCWYAVNGQSCKYSKIVMFLGLQEGLQKEIDAANVKVNILQNRFADTYKAWKWLENDGVEFKGKVLKPMMLEVSK